MNLNPTDHRLIGSESLQVTYGFWIFSCEEAALEVQMSVTLSVRKLNFN